MKPEIQEKIDSFFTQHKKQVYKRGEILIRADDSPAGVYYLKQGSVKQYLISKKGEEIVLNIFKPISFFPMSWAINSTENIYFFEAVDTLEVWRAPREDVIAFIKNNPDVLYDLMSRVYRGTDGMLLRMAYLMSGSAYARLITELLIHTKRFGKKTAEGSFELTVTEGELAMSAGMTRETISREMKTLKEKGIVVFRKNVLVVQNIERLESELIAES
jgi:CRP-like cAMP-binding protein